MPITHKTRYEGQFFSSNGRFYLLKIYDKNYTGQPIPITIGGGGVKIKYDTKGQEKFSPIIASKCAISLVVENNVFGVHLKNFIKDLRETYEEGDATVVIWNTGSTSDSPLWSGNILIDLSSKEDVSLPYEVELNATDGIGLLRNYDMVRVQGSSPYASTDTYISLGYQKFTYWISNILEYCNTPDSDSTDGDVSDYKFSTSIDWWYENHPTADPSVSPLDYTQCQMLGGYEIQDDGRYKVKSVYDVLESFCKMWGMRVVFWKNRFYFTQVELYNTADTGNFANPENIDSQIWNRNGTFSSSQDYLGNTHFSLYSQDIETNAGGFKGGLQKLAGSTWDYYPKLKEVSVDFENISNNNYFQTFPQPWGGSWSNQTDHLTSSPLGVINNASTFGGLNLNIDLEFNNVGNAVDYQYNFSIRARPNGDTDWDNAKYLSIQPGITPSWGAYPVEAAGGATAVWYDYFISQGATVFNYYMQYDIHPHVGVLSIPSGISQQTIFSQQVPTDAAFTGDWEFEIFTIAGYLNLLGFILFSGHHTKYLGISTLTNVTYADVLDANNNPVSQFNPILNNVIGGTAINTLVYSARSETQSQAVKDIWWGDTLTYGEPSSLIWADDAGNSGYTDPNGLWRNGQSGTFNKSISELLCDARLFNQQQSDYKWSLSTAVSETNRMINDGTGARPVYINPIGRIHDTVDEIFYYLLRGTFNILLDEWESEWLQVSLDNTITTTTTTTTTGGTSPTGNNAAARLSGGGQSAARLSGGGEIGSLRTRVASWSTVTELEINEMNWIADIDLDEYEFAQNTLIKSGDVFNIVNTGNGIWQQFTASADVENTDTTISVTSVDIEKPLEVGSKIVINSRDSYQQLNHKTRGTINISQYSFTERSTDAAFPVEGNSVMWMSDGTASGNDGDMLITINTGAALTTSKFDLTAVAATPFTFTVDTTASGSASDTFVLPLVNDGTISIYVNWGDGNSDIISTYNQTEITHQYSAGGTYSLTMQGTIRGFRFADAGDKAKMRIVSQWGDLNITQTMAFKGCIDMTCTASDAPTILDTTDLNSTFSNCTDLTGIGGAWNMAGVTNLDSFFYQCSVFNQDISAWNVSSVTNFDNLFFLNFLFNQNIGGWNTGAATTMVDMLDGNPSGAFNQDISSWDIADVTDFGTNFMREQTLSTANYDALLIAWDAQSVQSGLTLDFGNSQYTSGGAAATARANLISSDSWTISDGGAATPAFSNVYSLDFDGVDDYMLIASGFKCGATTSSFSAWFKRSSTSQDMIVSAGYPYVSDFSYWIDSGNRVRIDHPLYGSTGTFAYTLPDATAWYHLVVTLNQSAGEMKFYINGDLKDTKSTAVAVDAGSTPCYIGRWANGAWALFGGHIDEVANWSSTLSAAEVTAIYNSGEPTDLTTDAGDYASSSNLDGYWRNGDPDGTSEYPTITDDSSDTNDGTMTNMTSGDIVEVVPS